MMDVNRILKFSLGLGTLLMAGNALGAEQGLMLDAVHVTANNDGTTDYSLSLQVLAIMTFLSFLPAVIIMMTSFTRIIVVLSILRPAIFATSKSVICEITSKALLPDIRIIPTPDFPNTVDKA